jgi:hypothetical protein
MNDDDLEGPIQLAANTLLAVVMLHSHVKRASDVLQIASEELAKAFAAVAAEVARREAADYEQ